jgi:hypothetical protein
MGERVFDDYSDEYRCDECGAYGATDYYGDYYCDECIAKLTQKVEDTP